jgi:hypothetical protein
MTIEKALTTRNLALGQLALIWRFNMRFPEALRTYRLRRCGSTAMQH